MLEGIGLKRIDVVRAATAGGRELNGLGPQTVPEPGVAADLIVLEGSPLDDMSVLARPRKVMTYGRWVVDGGLPAPKPAPYV
jgi:imidazolonepropionase-like amidohydrolase